jgi:predicted RNA-binding protein with PUA-like domain
MVDIRLIRKLKRIVTLAELRTYPQLRALALLQRGNRLSIMPVTPEEWRFILSLE